VAFVALGGVPNLFPGFPLQSNSLYHREFKSRAIYDQIAYDLTKALTANLGARYTWDSGSYVTTNRLSFHDQGLGPWGDTNYGPCAVATVSAYQNYNPAACTGTQSLSSKAPSFDLSIEDKFAERSMIYAKLSRGYLVGGFNNQSVAGAQVFRPEKVVETESGLKSDWDLWDRPIRTNLAAFCGRYTDQQRVQNGITAQNVGYIAVANAGASNFFGFDLELNTRSPIAWMWAWFGITSPPVTLITMRRSIFPGWLLASICGMPKSRRHRKTS
jgi:iron complex outermembrane receptor protein